MQADFVTKLRKVLSHERLAAYQSRSQSSGDLGLFSHYVWNMALSESLYPGLQALEVALRNTIHNAAVDYYQRDDWYDDTRVIHYQWNVDSISNAKRQLRRQRKAIEPDRIVAELNFGFWTSLFDSRYEQKLWIPLIKPAFPYMPRQIRTRIELSKRLNRIRNLRNRVFHHEPIWYWPLEEQHVLIMETLGFIEPAMRDMVLMLDRFEDVYRAGPEALEQKLREFC